MALQDLTPQLRTRLSRMERAVGWFVVLAVVLLTFGFVYYVYNTAKRKGWFLTKAPYFTFVSTADGLRVGDPVRLLGFDAGSITSIQPMPGDNFTYNVYVEFELKAPNYDYMWTEGSVAKVAAADFLGKRVLEVVKGTGGYPAYQFHPLRDLDIAQAKAASDPSRWQGMRLAQEIYDASGTNLLLHALVPLTNLQEIAEAGHSSIRVFEGGQPRKTITAVWNDRQGRYDPFLRTNKYWLEVQESPALTERLEGLLADFEKALPNVLSLTNQLLRVLSNSAALTSNVNAVVLDARPAVSNVTVLLSHLDTPGALGDWLLPTNLNTRLEKSLDVAQATLTTADTNLTFLASSLAKSLENLAAMTSNLNAQVEANTNILSQISQAIVDADNFVQGLKHHWLLRSAFKEKKSPGPAPTSAPGLGPVRSPKDATKR